MSHELGKNGEAQAAASLTAQGYTILERNWRCAVGEVDIIAVQDDELVIVEVRTRRGKHASARALESVTPEKQSRLYQLAEIYRSQLDPDPYKGIRIDVVTVSVTVNGTFIEVYPNAVGW